MYPAITIELREEWFMNLNTIAEYEEFREKCGA